MKSPEAILKTLTNEEKVKLLSGQNMWQTEAIPEKEIPSMFMADGPHGLRKQAPEAAGGVAKAIPATCYPSAVLMGSTWNDALIENVGEAMGNEALEQDIDMILGPGINIKRHPYNGRNFEYFSEDPLVAGKLGAALIRGVQSRGVGTSLKHYVANNQETRRMVTDAIIDDKALNEIYLKAFEIAVKEGNPWTVMAAYNKVNGKFVTEHDELLTETLKKDWGYEGALVSDWGAVNDRVQSLNAGLSLEMPSSGGMHDQAVLDALEKTLDQATLDERVLEVLKLVEKAHSKKPKVKKINPHQVAVDAAAEGMVLLKNENLLPFSKDKKIALIGAFAKNPRYQGGGSSHINPKQLVTPYDSFKNVFKDKLSYADGYEIQSDSIDESLVQEAVNVAKAADQVVVIIGLPDSYESEGYDRTHLHLPPNQNALVKELSKVSQVAVVLMNGSPVLMPWLDDVPAILEAYLGGEGVGEALVDLITGIKNPSGKLAETFPLNMNDFPADEAFPGGLKQVVYTESIDVGYRAVDRLKITPLFAFGHGLSYATFKYSNGSVSLDQSKINVSLSVENTSDHSGFEVVQVYASLKDSNVIRSIKPLVGYQKVWVDAHQSKDVQIPIDLEHFKIYHDGSLRLEAGEYTVLVGASSSDIRIEKTITIPGESFSPSHLNQDALFNELYGKPLPKETPVKPYTLNSTLNDISSTYIGKKMYQKIQKEMQSMFVGDYDETLKMMFENMVKEMPLRQLISMSNGVLTLNKMQALIALMNKRFLHALKLSLK